MGSLALHHVGLLLATLASSVSAQAADTPTAPHPVLELRQYKLAHGKEGEFVRLFDSKFVDSQEADGMRLVGHFTDHDKPDRFTWIREFPDMDSRLKSLETFYYGPVWAANKAVANPMLDDNDNVMLLRAAGPDSGFAPAKTRPAIGAKVPHRTVFAVIEYLWKDPNEGFSTFFLDEMRPQLEAAGLPVLAAYVPEEAPNNFPKLPVRPDRKILVWFTIAPAAGDFDTRLAALRRKPEWQQKIAARLADYEERAPQRLRLDPAPRSALR